MPAALPPFMTESTLPASKSLIACIVFVDIVGYSKHSNVTQFAIKEQFNRFVIDLTGATVSSEQIRIDTGDGCAMAFLSDFQKAIGFATRLLEKVAGSDPHFEIRVGINTGPVKTAVDFNGVVSLVGDGMNAAQRIMSFAADQCLTLSGSTYDILVQEDESFAQRIRHIPDHLDKHGRQHRVYGYDWNDAAPAASIARRRPLSGWAWGLSGLAIAAVAGAAWVAHTASIPSRAVVPPVVRTVVRHALPIASAALPRPQASVAPSRDTAPPKPARPRHAGAARVSHPEAAHAGASRAELNAQPPILKQNTTNMAASRCSAILDKISLGAEQLTAEDQAFFKANCK
jgi:class 3 adenylate cyclase